MRLDKLVDVSVGRPFGYHCEVAIVYCNSQQREHVQMVEVFPQYNLFVEPLRDCSQLRNFGKLFYGDSL